MHGIYQQIEWEELLQAVKKVANGKYPGLNNVPPDALKALSSAKPRHSTLLPQCILARGNELCRMAHYF